VPRAPKVVDTNVCIVSNHRLGENLQCVGKCAKELNEIVAKGVLVIDANGGVLKEYKKYLSYSGEPGIGDLLFKWLVDNRYNEDRVHQITLKPHPAREGDFAEFPDDPALDGFDRDDRIFVALALSHPQRPAILTAVDSDYWHYEEPLTGCGVSVTHVCGHQHYKPRVPRH
jgi:hypothetical protein